MQALRWGWIVLALATFPAFAQEVTVDYAADFDFDAVSTFRYVDNDDDDKVDDLTDHRIRDGIVRRLEGRGLQRVDGDADLYVTYHLTTREEKTYNTTGLGYGGWGPGWRRWGGVGTAVTTATTYQRGTLIVDAYEPVDRELVWRGTGTVTISENPEKRNAQIEKMLAKMGKRWQKILENKRAG